METRLEETKLTKRELQEKKNLLPSPTAEHSKAKPDDSE